MQKSLSKLYQQSQMNSAGSGRQVEISILEMAAARLRACAGAGAGETIEFDSGIHDALRFNQKVWDVFSADWSDENCALEDAIRENLLSLSLFVKKRTFAMQAQPTRSGLDILIQLNDNLARGLKGAESSEALAE